MAPKRKHASPNQTKHPKRIKTSDTLENGLHASSSSFSQNPDISIVSGSQKQVQNNRQPSKMAKNPQFKGRVHKLAPPKPFPTISTGVSATGPKSTHKGGKNFICVSRKVTLGSYLSRCKKILVEEGYDFLCLHAMGAAIPHLLMLTVSLPEILPYTRSEIRIEIRTGTVEVTDELIPDDDDEDIQMNTRSKAGLTVYFRLPVEANK